MHPIPSPPLNGGLSPALAFILPSQEQTWLLHACLNHGESGRRAWETYQRKVRDPLREMKRDGRGIKTLAPLLLMALRCNQAPVDKELLTALRSLALSEELRSVIYRGILRRILSALTSEEIPHVVLKGAAFAETIYDAPALRHCHDIDLLIRDRDLARAASLLASLGFAPSGANLGVTRQQATLTHESGLPVQLLPRPFRAPCYRVPLEDLWRRSHHRAIAGVPTRTLSPADNLLHVCIQAASSGSRDTLRWVTDAWYLMIRHPDLDWAVLLDCATRSRLELPLSLTLDYLVQELNAPIPAAVLDRLRATSALTDEATGEAVLSAALTGARVPVKRLLLMRGGWRPRLLVLKWMLFPSPSYVRSLFHVDRPWLLPFCYIYRPLRFVARRIWSRCKRSTGSVGAPRIPRS